MLCLILYISNTIIDIIEKFFPPLIRIVFINDSFDSSFDTMVSIESYIPKAIRDVMDWKSDEELIRKTKLRYLRQISVMPSGGSLVIENLTDYFDVPHGDIGTDWVAGLADKLSLAEVYYHFTYILTCRCSNYIFKFDKDKALLEKYKTNIQSRNLFSENGLPLWNQDLTFSPKLWICYKEDEKLNHVYLLFISSGSPEKYFDIITHEVKTISKPGLIRCRMHLDDGLMEMSIRDFPIRKISDVLSFINRNFGLNPLIPIEITDANIRTFDTHTMVKQTTHEKREGEETTTALTRNTEDGDTRGDPIRGSINDREFIQENGIIEVKGENVTVYIKRGKWGAIQFSRYLNPDIQIAAIHKVKQILGW